MKKTNNVNKIRKILLMILRGIPIEMHDEEMRKAEATISVLLSKLKTIDNRNTQLIKKETQCQDSLIDLQKNVKKLTTQLAIYKKQRSKIIPEKTAELIKYYDNKYPKQDVVYAGTEIKLKNKVLRPKIHVSDYITYTRSMVKWLQDNKLMFNKIPTIENISRHAWRIYKKFTEITKYMTDKQLYGVNEQWQINSLQWYIRNNQKKLKGDCENMALTYIGLLLASGLPRGLFRVGVGMTNNGFGHASAFVYDWRTKKFEQWETTSTIPLVVKDKNPIYIKDFWFSFDNRHSWNTIDLKEYKGIKK